MIKLLALVAIIVGIWSGVLEVSWHPEHLADIPGKFSQFTGNSLAAEQARVKAVALKRQGEQYITKDEKQKLQMALSYVQADADTLQKEIADGRSPAFLVPQAGLLADSIRTMQGDISKASDKTLADIKSDAIKTTSQAGIALAQLQRIKTDQTDFNSTTDVLATLLGKSSGGQVAGAEDKAASPTPSPNPSAKIPLRF
jgi:hypothetical protein